MITNLAGLCVKAITHVRDKLQTVWVFTANKTRVEDALVVLTYRIA